MDNNQLTKIRVAINYYLYTIGAQELGEPFDKLQEDELIKNEIDNIKDLYCLYKNGHTNKNITTIIDNINYSPNKIIEYLNKNKELNIVDLDNEINDIIRQNKDDANTLDQAVIENDNKKKEIINDIQKLKKN